MEVDALGGELHDGDSELVDFKKGKVERPFLQVESIESARN